MGNRTCAVAFCFLLAASVGDASAQLRWESREVELRPGAAEEKVVAEFKFRNAGDYPVTIASLKASCDCTTAALEKRTYQPSEDGTITATFTIGQRQGVQDKTIVVKTDDPKEPTVLLRMRVLIPQVFEVSPRFVYWTAGEPPTPKTVTVKVITEKPVKVLSAASSGTQVTTELKEIRPGREYAVTVTPSDTSTVFTQSITLKSDLPAGRDTIRLYAAVRPPRTATTRPAGTTDNRGG